jgi:ribosomal-protein-alanine N-acetyltransferase
MDPGRKDDMTHKGTCTLETKQLLLRRFTGNDAEAMFRNWANDPEVTKYLTWSPHGDIVETRRILKNWTESYEKSDFYCWAIVPKFPGEPIGSISVVHRDDKVNSVHIGYCIGKAWWHHGYTSEALSELIRFFFEEVGVNRIDSRHDIRNPHSGNVMKKAGMHYEGTMRQADRNKQGICDSAYYAILAEDYQAQKSPHPLIGKTAIVSKTVEDTDTAASIKSGSLPVLATPALTALMEQASCKCLSDCLESGQTSVGTAISVEHTAASPRGAKITATAEITEVTGRKIGFAVTARDNAGEIGHGTHSRFIVKTDRFMKKAEARK